MRLLAWFRPIAPAFALVLCVSCGGDDSTGAPDAAATADAGAPDGSSTCGNPGDVGNEMGVGKYCASLGDCSGTSAPLCSSIGDPTTHFCTHTCANEDAGTAACGTGATCVCGGGGCGCTPLTCM
jgi:hypothetical protein